MKLLKKGTLLLLSISIIFLNGCWNYREISQYSIVCGLAIDKVPNSNRYSVTAEIADFAGSGKEAAIRSKTMEATGLTVFDAVRNMIKSSWNRLYFGHTQIYIISEELATAGIVDVLDWISRDAETRSEADLLVAKGSPAKSIFQKESSPIPVSFDINKTLHTQTALSKAYHTEVYKFINLLSSDGVSATLPVISKVSSDSDAVYSIGGTAIFKGDKLVGFLDPEETKFFLYATDKIKGGLLLAKDHAEITGTGVVLEVFKSKTKATAENINDQLGIKLDIRTEAAIAELTTTQDYIQEDTLKGLKSETEKQLESNIKKVIKKVQTEYGADIFGFGRIVKKDFPQLWNAESAKWSEIFRDLPVVVNAKLEVKNSAHTSQPIKIGD